MNPARLITRIAASEDGVPVTLRGERVFAVGYSQDHAARLVDPAPLLGRPALQIQIRRPDGSRSWVPASDVRRAR